MKPVDLLSIERRVCGYKTKRSATSAAVYVNSTGEQLSAYRCPFCDHFHVGHEPSKDNRKKIKRAVQYIDEHGYVSAR